MSIDHARDDAGTPEVFKDSRTRSLLKGLTWRIVATTTTIVIVWALTGNTQVALQIGAIEVVAKIIVYYLHERAWQLLPHNLKLLKARSMNQRT